MALLAHIGVLNLHCTVLTCCLQCGQPNAVSCSYATVVPSDIIVGNIEHEAQGEVARLYGSWLSFVDWNGSRYWDIISQPAELPQRCNLAPFTRIQFLIHAAACLSASDCLQTAASAGM